MATAAKIDRLIAALAHSQPSYLDVGGGCHDVFEQALPFDLAVWFSLDPATLLPTRFETRFQDPFMRAMNDSLSKAFGRGLRRFELKMIERVMRLELSTEDGLSPSALSQKSGHVATLYDVTDGHPDRNPRFNAFPLPGAIRDELRVLLKDAGEAWGMVWLARRDGVFSKEDQALVASFAPKLGSIVRMSLLREAVGAGNGLADPPGLILMADDVTIGSVSPEAEHLLGPWTPEVDWHWASVLRAMRQKLGRASMVVEGARGAVTVHTTMFGDTEAIIVERVRPYRLADRLVRTYGLTPRERDVAGGLSRGWSTRRIAFELDLADYTVQDHLGAIFNKVGVRSRKEVLAKLFFDRYMPEHRADSTPSPYGWFLGEPGK